MVDSRRQISNSSLKQLPTENQVKPLFVATLRRYSNNLKHLQSVKIHLRNQ
jgi:hypothetical protein